MLKQKQLFRHKPELGVIGDCHRTALACLLDMPAGQVPHFGAAHWGDAGNAFNEAVDAWLAEQGYRAITFAYEVDNLAAVLDGLAPGLGDVFYIIAGSSKNGTNHSVIGLRNEIYFDPSQDDSGIVGPLDTQPPQFQITFLVPMRFSESASQQKPENKQIFEAYCEGYYAGAGDDVWYEDHDDNGELLPNASVRLRFKVNQLNKSKQEPTS